METKILTYSTKTTSEVYQTTRKMVNGKPHIVVPVVMMLEGVHSGSGGAILHTAEGLQASTPDWADVPVVIHHPQDNQGNYITANSEGVIQFGKVKNPKWQNNKLKAEVWLDETKLIAHYPMVLNMLSNKLPLDVSIGAYTTEIIQDGEWNGEVYHAITESYIPDHLAILPGEEGACNWNDGCGIRANNQIQTNKTKNENMTKEPLNFKQLNEEGFAVYRISNSLSLNQLERVVRDHVNSMDDADYVYYLQDIFDDFFVYEKNTRYKEGVRSNPINLLFRQEYTINSETNSMDLVGEPSQVTRKVTYVPLTAMIRTKFNTNKESEMTKPSQCLLNKVQALITNAASQFTEQDRDWLLQQPEQMLDKLMPAPTESAPVNTTAPQINCEAVKGFIQTNVTKPEDILNLIPASMQPQFRKGIELQEAHRSELVQSIRTNSATEAFAETELNAMSTEMLEKLSKSLTPITDYSGNGGVKKSETELQVDTSENEMLLPTGVAVK